MKACPFCAEEIQDAAIKCRHCGSDLTVRAVAQVTEAPKNMGVGFLKVLGWLGAAFIAIVIIGAFLTPEDPDLTAFKAKRAAWHTRCDQYVGRTIYNAPAAKACDQELREMLAEGKRRGW